MTALAVLIATAYYVWVAGTVLAFLIIVVGVLTLRWWGWPDRPGWWVLGAGLNASTAGYFLTTGHLVLAGIWAAFAVPCVIVHGRLKAAIRVQEQAMARLLAWKQPKRTARKKRRR